MTRAAPLVTSTPTVSLSLRRSGAHEHERLRVTDQVQGLTGDVENFNGDNAVVAFHR